MTGYICAGSGQAAGAGNLCPRGLAEAGDGGGPGELQERDRRGGHVPRGRHQQEDHEAQTHRCHQGVKKRIPVEHNYCAH